MQRSIIAAAAVAIGLCGGEAMTVPVVAQSANAGTLTPNATPGTPASPATDSTAAENTSPATPAAPLPAAPPPAAPAPAAPSPAEPAPVAPPAGQSLEHGPARGANSFTRGQAQGRIARAGYRDVAGLRLDSAGVWRGTALRHGKKVHVWLDYTGRTGHS